MSQDSWENIAVLGALVVVVGVALEGIDWLSKFKKRNRHESILTKEPSWTLAVEFFSITLVVLGLCVEIFATYKASEKAHDKIKELTSELGVAVESIGLQSTNIAQLRELNGTLTKQIDATQAQLTNAETRLNEVRNENLPMDIGDQYSLAMALKPLSGIRVELRSSADLKAQETAELLFSTFAMAGWPVINRSLIGDLGEGGIIIGYNFHASPFGDDSIDDSSKNAANLLLQLLTERNVPSEIIEDPTGFRVRGVPTNAIIVAVCPRPSQLKADLMVVRAKETVLRNQSVKIWPRISELLSNRFVPNSKELAEAQAELNDLNSQESKSLNEERALSEQERILEDKEEKELFGTNSMMRGFHSYGDTFSGVQNPIIVASTNATIEMRGVRMNPQPLQ